VASRVRAMMRLLKDLMTERDGASFCIVRLIGAGGGLASISAFLRHTDAATFAANVQGFGIALGSIMAAVAFKNLSEK